MSTKYTVESFGETFTIRSDTAYIFVKYDICSNNVERFTELLNQMINNGEFHMNMNSMCDRQRTGFKFEKGTLKIYAISSDWYGRNEITSYHLIPREDGIEIVKAIIPRLIVAKRTE